LKERFAELFPGAKKEIEQIKKEHGDLVLGTCTISQAYGGMRSVKSMIYETSVLDAAEGIRFRGYTIEECQKMLPTIAGGTEPLPESLLWLLMTGEIPTQEEAESVVANLNARAELPSHVEATLTTLPKNMHPMTMFNIGVNLLQTESIYAEEYRKGIHKTKYWDPVYEDSMNLIARLPRVAAIVYRYLYRDGKTADNNPAADMSKNFANMLGYDNKEFEDLMRLYLVIHSDHEGGNASAHTTHLVGSTLADSYQSFAGGMQALAGPLHGLANQEVLRWLFTVTEKLGTTDISKEQLEKYVRDTLASGQVIPGYGHAVLRKTDPRYTCQARFASKFLPNDPMNKLVKTAYEVIPRVLTEGGKVANPWPNVDAHSGVLLNYYGMKEYDYYTVLFGVSRAIGVLSALVWDRALGLPLERPKSLSTQKIKEFIASQQK
jgi:citrate synthase